MMVVFTTQVVYLLHQLPATSRNSGFNVTQFVGVAVMPNGVSGATGDFFVAGSQDNGSQYFSGSTSSGSSTARCWCWH